MLLKQFAQAYWKYVCPSWTVQNTVLEERIDHFMTAIKPNCHASIIPFGDFHSDHLSGLGDQKWLYLQWNSA